MLIGAILSSQQLVKFIAAIAAFFCRNRKFPKGRML